MSRYAVTPKKRRARTHAQPTHTRTGWFAHGVRVIGLLCIGCFALMAIGFCATASGGVLTWVSRMLGGG